ncbi:MAG: transposase [Clostridia bacterium]|nr:transposase [Clostridia bacterium]
MDESIKFTNENAEGVIIEKYIIMPNHIHLLIELTAGGHGNPPLQDVVGKIKSYTTHKYGEKLWQRSYHDHCVRSENDYLKIWTYIDSNHQKWEKDVYYTK